jgi:hypothetical protein
VIRSFIIPEEENLERRMLFVRGYCPWDDLHGESGGWIRVAVSFSLLLFITRILTYDTEPLNRKHAVVGYDLEGREVVDAIALVDTGGDTKPEVDVVIYTITILSP